MCYILESRVPRYKLHTYKNHQRYEKMCGLILAKQLFHNDFFTITKPSANSSLIYITMPTLFLGDFLC